MSFDNPQLPWFQLLNAPEDVLPINMELEDICLDRFLAEKGWINIHAHCVVQESGEVNDLHK